MTDQCHAHNDAMEGHQCHGEQGHRGLHWVEFDDGTSEWGDNDELWGEVDRLRAVIENAPHQIYSDDTACPVAYGEEDAVCTCWKADVL